MPAPAPVRSHGKTAVGMIDHWPMRSNVARLLGIGGSLLLVLSIASCRSASPGAGYRRLQHFDYQVPLGAQRFQIEGYLARSTAEGRLPALLILNGGKRNARQCLADAAGLNALAIQVACVSIPGYGGSSGPSRFVGPAAVAAARRGLDLLAARPDVDPDRLALWGFSNGAVAAGLVMDSDPRLRAVVLESGAYDLLKFWPQAPWIMKLAILHQVWPSRRALRERSVMAHLPDRLTCRVLIVHGARDRRTPISEARKLERALKERGARVKTCYFPKGPHRLGARVQQPVEKFLRESLIASN